ncbi:hypothetical protein [Mycobacterium sp. DL440]|uniref:hypothetical protein n=1 Tax=Mycobacterium sp. DL440 TaxID=2675523 RepID=UPI001AAEF574|nr:hypothetical protein [Mycobacterium sp. DL440]
MLNSTGLAEAIGANGKLKIYSGTVPANADAANAGTLLAELTLAATPFSGFTDATDKGRATFGPIASDTSADNTGVASFFRIENSGSSVKGQGTVGTSAADLVLNTTAITAGSTVAVTSGTIDLPEG